MSREVRKALRTQPRTESNVQITTLDHMAYAMTYLTGVSEWTAFDLWAFARELEKTFFPSSRRVVHIGLDLVGRQLCLQTAEKADLVVPGETKDAATTPAPPPPALEPATEVLNDVRNALQGCTDAYLLEVSAIAQHLRRLHGPATPATQLYVTRDAPHVVLRLGGLERLDLADIDGLRHVCGTHFHSLCVDLTAAEVLLRLKIA